MKLLIFYVVLLQWPCMLAQEEFTEDYKAEAVENNVAFSQDETKNDPSEVFVEDYLHSNDRTVGTESLETVEIENNKATVENNVVFIPAEDEQDPREGVAVHDVKNNNNIGIASVESAPKDHQQIAYSNIVFGESDTKQTSSEAFPENKIDNDDNVEIGSIEMQTESEQNYYAETVANNAYNPVEVEEKFIEVVPHHEVDDDDDETDSKEILPENDFQKDNENSLDNNVSNPIENDKFPNKDFVEYGIGNQEPAGGFGTDYIEIFGLPQTLLTPSVRSTIRYSIAGPRILVIDIFAVGVDHVNPIYHTEWTEVMYYAGETKQKILRATLPDNLVYKEDKILHISPDLHSESLLVRACIVDYKNPSSLLLYTEHSVKLIPPYSRMAKYNRYSCRSWIGMFYEHLDLSKIPKCPKIDDVVELLSFPVALLANEYGYKRFFPTLHESTESINRSPQFTLATWLYLTKRCSKDMCPLLYHIKGTAYQTPLIGLLKSGHLHLQFHYKDGSGYAFLVDARIPIHKWVHIAVTIKHTVVSVYIRTGRNLEHVKTFVHSDFPAGLYHLNDTDGYWGLGGSPGFISAQGFIGPARIYRRQVLSQKEIETIFTTTSRPNLGIADHFKTCRKLTSRLRFLLRIHIKTQEYCLAKGWIKGAPSLYCDVGTHGLAAEILQTVTEALKLNETIENDVIKQSAYNHAFNLAKTGNSNVSDALLLLTYSSCLVHPQSLYLLSVLHRIGLGVSVDTRLAQRSLLIGALYNHPLSQMSLAYKYYIGVDGVPKDHEVASTYYRYAAVQSNRLLVEHNEVDTHSEAVRLDKKEDLENYRGPNSNWFSWLKHQAKRGVTDAQSALGEVFYYGSRGFRRNLTKAAEFYEMGANRGDAQMLFNLGVVKLRGQGVAVNAEEARDLLMKSAELGFAPANNALGYYELNVRQNKSGAVEYFRYAAEQGDRDGLYNLGFALENGLTPGAIRDPQSAIPYYISAANKGHSGACVVAGDGFSLGEYVRRDTKISIIFYKFVADQIPEIGFHLRNGLDGYFEKNWYQSLLYYLLAAEAGMEVAQYNAALLCEWDWGRLSRHTKVDCAWRYYNHSAKLEWVPSLLKTGDNHWYGITAKKNITVAAQLYSQAATKEQNPQAIYNLGYLIEYNYPLDGLTWLDFLPSTPNPGNLTLAAAFYRKCRDTSDEALVPCSLGLLRVVVKMAWQLQLVKSEILLIPLIISILCFALLFYLCRLSSDYQAIDLA